MFEGMIMDADICIKLGSNEKYPFLEQLVPVLAKKAYIHQCVYDEILIPASVKKQIHTLIDKSFIEVIDEAALPEIDMAVYKSTYRLLARVMINPHVPSKNKGEAASLAMAKTLAIPIFATDEAGLQTIMDKLLNNGLIDIKCFRIIDLVNLIKQGQLIGFNRKQAKAIWRMSGKGNAVFDNEIWPL